MHDLESRLRRAVLGRCLGQFWFLSVSIAIGIYINNYTYYVADKMLHFEDDDRAVTVSTYFTILYCCSQAFVGAPLLGRASDIYGRRYFLLLGACLNCCSFPLLALFPQVAIFLIVALVMGCFDASTSIVRAIVVDFIAEVSRQGSSRLSDLDWNLVSRLIYCLLGHEAQSTAELLTMEFLVLTVHTYIGMFIGIILGEILQSLLGVRLAVASAGFICIPCTLAIACFFPETHDPHLDESPRIVFYQGFSFDAFRRVVTALRQSYSAGTLLIGYAIGLLGVYGINTVLIYFAEDVAHLGSLDVSALILEALIIAPVSATIGLRLLAPRLGFSLTFALFATFSTLGALGIALSVLLLTAASTAATNMTLFIAASLYFVGFAFSIIVIGPISNAVPHADQGTLQGILYALSVAATVGGGELATVLYTHVARHAPFFACAIFSLLALIAFLAAGDESSQSSAIAIFVEDQMSTTNEQEERLLLDKKDEETVNISI